MEKPPEIDRETFEEVSANLRDLLREPDESFNAMVEKMSKYPLKIREENLMSPDEDPMGLQEIPDELTIGFRWDIDEDC